MFRKMVSILLALCLLLALSATALADWTSEPVTLTIVHEHTPETAVTVASSRMFLKVCDDFLAAYPNVKLEVTAYGAGEIWEKLSVLAAANDLADIVYMNSSIFRSIVGDGMLLDITDTLDASLFRDNLTTFAADGKVYGVPTKATTYNYMFYNPEIWAKAGYETIPTTWDEFIVACEKVRALGYTPVSNGNKTLWNVIANYFTALTYECCGKDWVTSMCKNDGTSAYTDQCFIDALNWLKKISVIWNLDFNTADDQWAVAEFCKGKAAATISGSWVPGSIKSYEKDYPGISTNTRIARIPTISGGDPVIVYAIPQAVGINSELTGNKLEAAKAFAKFMGSNHYSTYMAEVGEMGPVPVDIDTSTLLPMQQDMFAVMNSYDNVYQLSSYTSAAENTAMQTSVSSFLAGIITAEECAAEIQACVPKR